MVVRAKIVVESNGLVLATSPSSVSLGSRTGNDIVLDDTMVADRHCRFECEEGFRVRDLGSVIGTWIDGVAAQPSIAIADGNQIVLGATKLLARIETRDGVLTLVLELQRREFWWNKPGKGAFDNDPDALVRSELAFGRYTALRVGNRLAVVAAVVLLVAGVFFAVVREPLTDAGPLLPAHAFVASQASTKVAIGDLTRSAQLHAEQGCNVCHSAGAGAPAEKCLQCHTELVDPTTRRHPYVVDGKLGDVPGITSGESFCMVCHRDHQGTAFLKPAAERLVGQCATCHSNGSDSFDQAGLLATAILTLPPERQRPFATYRFPHDKHLGKHIDCVVCHQIDPEVRAETNAGMADDPDRHDFAVVPYKVCASCHVPSAPASQMTAAQQTEWRSKDHQWPVAWHGTDDEGKHCQQCHAPAQRDGRTVFGPDLRTVERPNYSVAQHSAERANYIAGRRRHDQEFASHSGGQDCGQCHLHGQLDDRAAPPARPFWHALHVAEGSLAPAAGGGATISRDTTLGCVSCHNDLAKATALRTAEQGGYRWPATSEAQVMCRQCHSNGDEQLVLQAAVAAIPAERRAPAADFPHDVHVGSKTFGAAGTTLAEGCFACHQFESATGEPNFRAVPRTKPAAAACTQCHTGHEQIGGGSCQQCHPTEVGRSNSFLQSAQVPKGSLVGGRVVPPAPSRSWPGANHFSHLSRGHVGDDISCDTCHGKTGIEAAQTIGAVRIPDDATPACRDCHIRRQFHWR